MINPVLDVSMDLTEIKLEKKNVRSFMSLLIEEEEEEER
jgi:hypothetical protein